ITVYDSLGVKHEMDVTYTKSAAPAENTWTYAVSSAPAVLTGGSRTVVFNTDGTLDVGSSTIAPITMSPLSSDAADFDVALLAGDGDMTGLTQMRGASTPMLSGQDGYAMGDLIDYA